MHAPLIRAKKFGVRKAWFLRSPKSHAISAGGQNCSGLLLVIAIGICVVSFVLPFFNQLAEKSLKNRSFQAVIWSSVQFWLVFGLVIGFLAGLLSWRFYISKLNTIVFSRESFKKRGDNNWLTNGLALFSMLPSPLFECSRKALIVNKQIQFYQSTSLVFKKRTWSSYWPLWKHQETRNEFEKKWAFFREVLASRNF